MINVLSNQQSDYLGRDLCFVEFRYV